MAAAVRRTGAGSELPVETSTTEIAPESSVVGGLFGSEDGTNSWTVPVTITELPTAAAAGGAEDVNTKTPSEVFGSASASTSGVWRKKPFDLAPVTMPDVDTTEPARGDVAPPPWIVWIGVRTKSSFVIVPTPCPSATVTFVPTTLVTLTKNVSFGSTFASPFTVTSNRNVVLPAEMLCPTRERAT